MTTTILAIYGAVLSTITLAAGLINEWARRRVRIRVTINFGWLHIAGNSYPAIDLTAINESAFPVTVTGIGFDAQDGSGNLLFLNPTTIRTQLPVRVESRSSLTEAVTPDTLGAGLDMAKPVRGWVKLATGTYHRSAQRRLAPGTQDANLKKI